MSVTLVALVLIITAALVLCVLVAKLQQGGALRTLQDYCHAHPLPPTKTTLDHLRKLERVFLTGIKEE